MVRRGGNPCLHAYRLHRVPRKGDGSRGKGESGGRDGCGRENDADCTNDAVQPSLRVFALRRRREAWLRSSFPSPLSGTPPIACRPNPSSFIPRPSYQRHARFLDRKFPPASDDALRCYTDYDDFSLFIIPLIFLFVLEIL